MSVIKKNLDINKTKSDTPIEKSYPKEAMGRVIGVTTETSCKNLSNFFLCLFGFSIDTKTLEEGLSSR
jgi:hypothetical protein